jgi:hypothetical protein
MSRAFFVIVVFSSLLVSCTQRVICPAYQSAYIYDKDQVRKKFSYFVGDSTPKVYAASKTKYLIAEPTTYKKKVRSLQTVPMKRVIPVVPDSLKEGGMDSLKTEMDVSGVERNVNDSTAVLRIDTLAAPAPQDSIYVISKDREVRVLKYKPMERKYYVDTVGYNSEQDTYMWYLRDVLLLPDAKLAQQPQGDAKGESGGAKKKKGIKGFFLGLFNKKDKTKIPPQDSTQNIVPAEEEDYGYDDFEGKEKDSTVVDTQVQPQAPTKEKKGLFSKKKNKSAKKTETPPAKKEESDDGF